MSNEPRPNDDELSADQSDKPRAERRARPAAAAESAPRADGGVEQQAIARENVDVQEACRLAGFARNRYFHGKLMTARDMELDQDYHAGRFETFLQHVAGEGVVCGLTTTVDQDNEDDDLEVAVSEGFAIDCCGRPVVLPGGADETFTTQNRNTAELVEDATTDEGISLFVRYDECAAEKVPIKGSEDACAEECTYNRIVEDYEIELRAGAPGPKPVRSVDFPKEGDLATYESGDGAAEDDPGLHGIAMSYYESDDATRPCDESGNPLIFLGHFRETGAGEGVGWERVTDESPRPYVYDNDMLYAAIARHATDFENPHDVVATVKGVEPGDGDVDLTADDTIDIEARPDDHEVSFAIAQWILDSIISSINGVEPDDEGNVDLVSDSGTVDVDPDAGEDHQLSLDVAEDELDAIFTLSDVEPDDDGDLELRSSDEVTVNPIPGNNAISFGIDEAGLDGIVTSISDVDPGGDGDVELFSDSEILGVEPRGGNRLEITFDEAEVPGAGAVETVHGVSPTDAGDVQFVSPTETIDPTPNAGANQVELDLAERIRGQLDAHCRYVLDKTLKTTIRSFYRVADVYSETDAIPDIALEIIRLTRDAIEAEVFRRPPEFADAADEIHDIAEDILTVITDNLATDRTRDAYEDALAELEERLAEIDLDDVTCTDAVRLAVALDWVCETARWLHSEDDPRIVTIPGTDEEIESPIVHDLVRDGRAQ